MQSIIDFFKDRGFSIGNSNSDIRPCNIRLSEDNELSHKIKNNVFIYDNHRPTKTSFYLITVSLEESELYKIRRFIWNQNKFDLYFTTKLSEDNFKLSLYYAQSSPKSPIKIESFKGDEKDTEKLQKICRWKFDSGAFWYEYTDKYQKIKKSERVDTKLVERLSLLRNKLQKEYYNYQEIENKNEIVQALIDRTLFIKFLEDNSIINSYFYEHFFNNCELEYKHLLNPKRKNEINRLFDIINKIFNNVLFDTPHIKNEDLLDGALQLIREAIEQYDWTTKQLSLFDFRFNVIPVEFIGHIYKVFLEDKQRKEGIYYTPKMLAQLIVDKTITKIGTILDPSCGSGMFLVLAFRKILKEHRSVPKDIRGIIEFRNSIIKDYIFGIEKQSTARRLAIFSLYLELFHDLNCNEIKELIKEKLENDNDLSLFPYDFTGNIIKSNSLQMEPAKIPHEDKKFDFIIGNPPFGSIDENSIIERSFWANYKLKFVDYLLNENIEIKISNVVGHKQISQCFMLRIKEWAKPETRFGFVLNSSNFYNEKSIAFQDFFYKYYNLDKFYELSEVKKILFINARESVCAVIFKNNQFSKNLLVYQPVHFENFSKIFRLLIINEDNAKLIEQTKLLENKKLLRHYLLGNESDLHLISYISRNDILESILSIEKNFSFSGLKRVSNLSIAKYFKIPIEKFKSFSNKKKKEYHEIYAREIYLNDEKTDYFNIPYLYEPRKIIPFKVTKFDGYINECDVNNKNFQRARSNNLFEGEKILFNRFGTRIQAAYIKNKVYFSTLIYCIKLKEKKLYPLIVALLNSNLLNYYLAIKKRKRQSDNFPNIETGDIKEIPLPKLNDDYIVENINDIVCKLLSNEISYDAKVETMLNSYIYDLYNLSFLEKRRIEDFFAESREVNESDLNEYRKHLSQTLEIHLVTQPIIKAYIGTNLPFKMVVVAMYFNYQENHHPSEKKYIQYILQEIISINPDENFIALKEKVFGKDCIYILKDNNYLNWTTTKAYEDGQEILKRLRG